MTKTDILTLTVIAALTIGLWTSVINTTSHTKEYVSQVLAK